MPTFLVYTKFCELHIIVATDIFDVGEFYDMSLYCLTTYFDLYLSTFLLPSV